MSIYNQPVTRFRYHITLALVSILTVLSVLYFSGYSRANDDAIFNSVETGENHYIEKYSNENEGRNEILRIERFIEKKGILLFGSSELSSREMPMIPYRFFNDSLKIPLLAIGHAGFQGFSVFLQLAGLDLNLENYPVVILLSPGWFHDKSTQGTELGPFFEFATDPYLYSVYRNKNLPDEFRLYAGKYIHRHFPEISNPNAIFKAFYYSYNRSLSPLHNLVFSPPVKASGLYCGKKVSSITAKRGSILPLNPSPVLFPEENWKKLQSYYTEEHLKNSSNNSWGVENSYYDAWLRNSGKKTIYPASSFQFTEMEDLEVLLRYLKFKKATPLFILQPLNPYAYENLKELDPVMTRVSKEINRYGFPILNMWTSDPSQYIPGTLKDVMHLGNPGWCEVNKKILDYYNHLAREKN